MQRRGFTLVELMIVIAIIAVISAIAVPNLIEARKHANESAAIGALKTVSTVESVYRDGDRDKDGVLDYGMLSELSSTLLIDQQLGSGTKQGYRFTANYSFTSSQFLWFATARPLIAKTSGDRYFCENQAGVIFYTSTAPFGIDTTSCARPAGSIPLGK